MQAKENEVFVGIDISKSHLDIATCGGVEEEWRIRYDAAGLEKLGERLRELAPTLIVMEATGGLEAEVAVTLAGRGLPVVILNPRQAREFGRAMGSWRRRTGSTRRCWPSTRSGSGPRCGRCRRRSSARWTR